MASTVDHTEVCFARRHSIRFISMEIINPQEKKLANCTFVDRAIIAKITFSKKVTVNKSYISPIKQSERVLLNKTRSVCIFTVVKCYY